MARRVAEAVARAGGRTFFVGGYVRDRLMGLENKDIDIEVHGVSVRALEDILDGLGTRTTMGASFGVMGLSHYDLDIAMPRSEKATGRGHKDFEVFVDPFIGPEKAAMRRDFTMNALMEDVLTGEVLDFFGGRADMAAGVIRHVNDRSFVEDPLRVFRAAQFAARFGFEVAGETIALSSTMAADALAPERVMGELEKALLKAERPSVFFDQLRRMNQLCLWFAELEGLDVPAWKRTMSALDAASPLRGEAKAPLSFMLAALCADLSGEDARRLLARLTNAVEVTRYALNMNERLRALDDCLQGNACEYDWMALYDGCVAPGELILLARSSRGGSEAHWPDTERELRQFLALYTDRMSQPFLMGRDLLEAGVKPGPGMGEALAHAHRLRLEGAPKAAQLTGALACLSERNAPR